ncbi:MAG: hypothetical protein KME05_12450 [Gloeocapsa sp. UFS-A4-WI-NPMV-4B04]|nr:hypothetical protein [Gloeocapsa sp. UFS-A4-WI-NPMV-4B04]
MFSTLESIAKHFNRLGLPYKVDPIYLRIITWVRAASFEILEIVFQLSANENLLHIELPHLLFIKDHVYKGVIFQTLLSLLDEQRMLRFAYNPDSGEVYASIDLLLLDNTQLTDVQLQMCLNNLIYLVDEIAMPRLKQILATGEDSGQASQSVSHQREHDS